MDRLFGTDGIRAVAGEPPLDYSTICHIGAALVSLLGEERLEPRVLIGRDTRESGGWIEEALFQGIARRDGTAVSSGVIPTSAISYLTKKHGFSAGIVISASHNPFEDNGIKIFSSRGTKIPEAWERKIEKAIKKDLDEISRKKASVSPQESFTLDYMKFLKDRFSHVALKRKIKVVLDCSNGASSFIAPRVFSDLGIEAIALSNSPDGKNINAGCGSLYPQTLAREVAASRADMGIAYDGDADRAIWVDEKGRILNGDHTLFVLSRYMKDKGLLKSDYVVATTMSNIGLEKAIEELGLKLLRTQVGDKYVLEQMMRLKANLGGEQSGHTIFLDDCPTGDGILTSLKMLEVMAAEDSPLSVLVRDFKEFPQTLVNVRVAKKVEFSRFPEIMHTIKKIEDSLGESGRLNVRYSGTEPVARIMIEGDDSGKINDYSRQVADVIRKYLGD
ncbi:MAG: phosphoglucosamine mutase [Candidatus Aminicenantes bacterium]|nr:phosphoglucosamine mutase [Candidatus Aminicenantes bacterium]